MLSSGVSLCLPLSSKLHGKADAMKEPVCVLEDFLLFSLVICLCFLLCFDFFGLDLFVLVFVAEQINTGRDNSVTSTRVKISQLVASLQTSRQQVAFARLVTSCQQVWNKLLTTCNNLVDIVRLVTRLFQQGCYNHDITILLQPCVVNLVTFLLYHDCIRLVRTTL